MDVTVTNKTVELETKINGEEIIEIRKVVKDIPIAEPVQEYALQLVINTHPELADAPAITKQYIAAGASPRAAQAIFTVARAKAFLEGRYNVSFEDIKYVAYPALRHRIALNFDAMSEGISADAVVKQLIELK